jgi:hypothetical protein
MHLPKSNGSYSWRVRRYVDIPSFYLGGEAGNSQFDGGMQYEGARSGSVEGWAAFISYNSLYRNPQIWVTDAQGKGKSTYWRKSTGGTISEDLEFRLFTSTSGNNGYAGLKVGGLSSYGEWFYWTRSFHEATVDNHLAPSVQGNCWDPNDYYLINVKRVTAMTRDNGGANLSGSWLQTDWTNCTAYWYTSDGTQHSAGLNASIVIPSRTGYDAPGGRGAGAYDKDGNAANGALPKVDFPNLSVPTDVAREPGSEGATYKNTTVSRYQKEDVNIWLRLPTPLKKGK